MRAHWPWLQLGRLIGRAILLSGGTASGHCCSPRRSVKRLCASASLVPLPLWCKMIHLASVGGRQPHRVIYDRHKDDHEIMVSCPSQLTYIGVKGRNRSVASKRWACRCVIRSAETRKTNCEETAQIKVTVAASGNWLVLWQFANCCMCLVGVRKQGCCGLENRKRVASRSIFPFQLSNPHSDTHIKLFACVCVGVIK